MRKHAHKFLAVLLTIALLLSCMSMLAAAEEAPATDSGADCPSARFTDVDTGKWYHEPIDFVVERELMQGMTATQFGPNIGLTRGMLVTILYRYENSPETSGEMPFTDVPAGRYFTEAVAWAAEHDIVKGVTETTFQPNAPITREQMVVILYRYAAYKGVDVSGQASLSVFPDAGNASKYAEEPLAWAVSAGLIVGDNRGKLLPKGGATRAEAATVLQRYIEKIVEKEPVALTVTSNIFGSGDTGGKTTLKNILVTAPGPGDQTIRYSDPETGERLDYPVYNEDGSLFSVEQPPVFYTGAAVLRFSGDVDDSKIDSSKAVVRLLPGDGYVPEELVLAADTLEGTWKNGTLDYTLKEYDLEWNIGDYEYIDNNSGREWSILGGDGNGCYTFTFEVSGITYDGQPVDPVTFPVRVYIWGRTGTDVAASISDIEPENHLPHSTVQSDAVTWTWVGDQGDFFGAEPKPVLCDDKQDDFFITWPEGSDASGLTAEDVTITLNSQYGVSYQLKSQGEHIQYAVYSSKEETQVAVTFRHAAFTPVFTTMTIAVNGQGLSDSKTYDIASVYAFMLQQGGGGLSADGVCTAYSYYGYEGLSIANAVKATYSLKYVDENGTTWYYAEDEEGNGYLSEAVEKTVQGFTGPMKTLVAPDDAVIYDAMGPEDCDVQFIVNTLMVKTRLGKTEVKTVNGEAITFDKAYTSGQIGNWDGVSLAPGYVRTAGFSPNQQWAWSPYYGSGWSPELSIIPTDFPYTSFPFGDYADKYAPVSTGGPGGPGGPNG